MRKHRYFPVTPPIFCTYFTVGLFVCGVTLTACGGSLQMRNPEQGLQGTFSTYGLPIQVDCRPLPTQVEKDSCRRINEHQIVEPYHGSLTIHNLSTQEKINVNLDAAGSYKVQLIPGQYEVCLAEECSDPLEIRLGKYSTYGQRLPRAAADSVKQVSTPADSVKNESASKAPDAP